MFVSWLQAVLNQKFTDCFVLVFLDAQAGKTVSSILLLFVLQCSRADTSVLLLVHLLPPTEPKGRVPGAAAVTAAGRQQPPPSACFHVPPP